MNVIIKPVKSFMVETEDGRKLGLFTKSSEWNGLADLRQGGEKLIVATGETPFDEMISGLFGTPEASKSVPVIQATGKISAQLKQAHFDRT